MSDRAVQSYDGDNGNGMTGRSMQPNQSVWMAHWMQTSSKSPHEAKQPPSPSEPGIASDIFAPASKFRGVTEARTVNIMDQRMPSSSNSRKEDLKSFPMFNICRYGESIMDRQSSKPSTSSSQVVRPQMGHNNEFEATALDPSKSYLPCVLARDQMEAETSSRRFQMHQQGVPSDLEQRPMSRSLQDDFIGSSSAVPYAINGKKSPGQTFMYKQQTKKDTRLNHGAPGPSSLRENDMALSINDPSMSNYQLLDLLGEQHQKVQHDSAMRLFPSQSCSHGVNELGRYYHGCHSPQQGSYSIRDVETVRICTTTVEDIHKGRPMYSQTTRHLLITEKTDVNMSDEGQVFRGSMASSQFKGNAIGDLLSLSLPSGIHGQQGLKLQLLESSTDTEQNEKVEDAKISVEGMKNESSAETDAMDLDAFQENNILIDLASSQSKEDIMEEHDTQAAETKVGLTNLRVGNRLPDLPDINEEPPAIPATASPISELEQSSSRTQSLEVECLLSHSDYPSSSKSRPYLANNLGPEPSSRWVKRLKLISPDSVGLGTKSLTIKETTSHEKKNKFLGKILKGSINSPNQTLDRSDRKEHRELGHTAVVVKNGETSSTDSVKKGKDINLSNSWIKRWCHSQAASSQKKLKAVALCEPQSSKAAFDDFQKKQFPSIAAMALMGKAMYGFPPCEFRKRGPLIVWNTSGF